MEDRRELYHLHQRYLRGKVMRLATAWGVLTCMGAYGALDRLIFFQNGLAAAVLGAVATGSLVIGFVQMWHEWHLPPSVITATLVKKERAFSRYTAYIMWLEIHQISSVMPDTTPANPPPKTYPTYRTGDDAFVDLAPGDCFQALCHGRRLIVRLDRREATL